MFPPAEQRPMVLVHWDTAMTLRSWPPVLQAQMGSSSSANGPTARGASRACSASPRAGDGGQADHPDVVAAERQEHGQAGRPEGPAGRVGRSAERRHGRGVRDLEHIRYLFELGKLDYVAGKPDVVAEAFGKNPPPPLLTVPKKDGQPVWTRASRSRTGSSTKAGRTTSARN